MPNDDTNLRLQYLAKVGEALVEGTNETSMQTNLFVAKEALNKFSAELTKLELAPEIAAGMSKLITYLHGKIDRRMHNSLQDSDNA